MKKQRKIKKGLAAALFIVLLICTCYITAKLPMQELKIIAMTQADDFDTSGTINVYCFRPAESGVFRTVQLKFMAVPNTSKKLFTSLGTGQYVYFGCTEMHAESDYLSMGKFMKIRLALNINENDLKLADGTPFDKTKYSLKPVLTITEK